ncbi:MAG: polyphosphate polymerase domain-containing protein [Eggerthellaceae bacterium]|nr:polyphosphate polymerase domain-containing protein [Eggerthellaceae bacterium]
MATASDTFERKEKKYLISVAQCEAIKRGLSGRMRLDDYGKSRIDSLYLDTVDHDLICKSLEKPLYKEKLRIRSYGAFSEADIVYVEIKKKFKGIVYKRRVRMSAEGARAYYTGTLSYEDAQKTFPVNQADAAKDLEPGKIQIARELDAFFKRHEGLMPAMVISCQREAWCPVAANDGDCVDRITFDEHINYIDLFEAASVKRRPVISDDLVVMEIKCAGGYPLWLCDLLAECGARPRSFSKYGNAYKRVLAEREDVSVRDCAKSKVVVRGIPRKPAASRRLAFDHPAFSFFRRRKRALAAS